MPTPGPVRTSTLAPAALVVALAGAVTGCGGESGDSGSRVADPAASSSAASSASPSVESPSVEGPAPTSVVTIVSQTAAGGEVSAAAAPLPDAAAVRAFGDQFASPELGVELARAVERTDVPAGSSVYAAVVAIGCDVPADVVVTEAAGGVLVEPAPAKPSGVQCLAPVTSVAVVLVADA